MFRQLTSLALASTLLTSCGNFMPKDASGRANSSAAALTHFQEYVETTMDKNNIPGLGISVVKDGKVILSKGFGYRDIENKTPVTEDTLFAIGSTTKAFTATSVGILADRGDVNIDSPVKDYLTDFELMDAQATKEATPRDLMLHRTGIPRHEFVWLFSPDSREQLYNKLKYLPSSAPFRSEWQYNNFMFMTTGLLIEKLSGNSWESFVHDEILSPLGMNRTDFSVNDMEKDADAALGYLSSKTQEPVNVPYMKIDAMGPAGSMNSSAKEMAQWVLLNLNEGVSGDGQIISQESLEEIHRPQMKITSSSRPELSDLNYGLAWVAHEYSGHKLVWHNGSIDGFSALVSFLPEEELGIVILMNSSNSTNLLDLALVAYDELLGLPFTDWVGKYEQEHEETKPTYDPTEPVLPLESYVGEFVHPAYGIVQTKVVQDGDKKRLVATLHTIDINLLPAKAPGGVENAAHVFFAEGFSFAPFVQFGEKEDGTIETLQWQLEPDKRVKPILFERQN
ncbi:MAG: serine hydrolase domain-containing protein [Oligoflexales bacterium]